MRNRRRRKYVPYPPSLIDEREADGLKTVRRQAIARVRPLTDEEKQLLIQPNNDAEAERFEQLVWQRAKALREATREIAGVKYEGDEEI
jgi:hypothetical protein